MSAWFTAAIRVTDRNDIAAGGKIDAVTGPYVRLLFQDADGSSISIHVPLAIVDEIVDEIQIARAEIENKKEAEHVH